MQVDVFSANHICPSKVRAKSGVENVIFHNTLLISPASDIRLSKLNTPYY